MLNAVAFLLAMCAWLVFMVAYSYRAFRHQYTDRVHGKRAPPGFGAWFIHQFVGAKKFQRQTGGMNIGGIMMLGISMVFLAIGFIFLPITTTAAQSLLDYEYTGGSTINATDATYTGFTAVVGITPLLILVGFLSAAVITGMMGIRIMKGGAGGGADPGSLMMLGLSIVFIGIGLIIEPVMLDGISSVYDDIYGSTSFTGYNSVVLVTPMLVHLGFISAAVLSGFFGIKRLGAKMSD